MQLLTTKVKALPCENDHLRQHGPYCDNQEAQDDSCDEAPVNISKDGGEEGDDPEEAIPSRPRPVVRDLKCLPACQYLYK